MRSHFVKHALTIGGGDEHTGVLPRTMEHGKRSRDDRTDEGRRISMVSNAPERNRGVLLVGSNIAHQSERGHHDLQGHTKPSSG